MMVVWILGSGRFDGDRETLEAAQRIVVAPLDRPGDFDGGDFSCQRRQQHFAFEAGDQLADTHMDAGSKPDVAAGAARNVIRVGIVPPPRIAVGGGEQHENFLALADRRAADLDILRGGSEKGLHRAFETDRFLEGVAG